MKAAILSLVASVVIFAPFKSPAITYYDPPTSIVQNGNFGAGLTDWTLSGGMGLGFYTSGGADGGKFILLDSNNRSPISQGVPTTHLAFYTLTFYMRGCYPEIQTGPFAVDVIWNSVLLGHFTVTDLSSDWVLETLKVEGGHGTQTTLQFNDPYLTNVEIDDISLVPVPEPSTFTLVGSGVAIALAWVRRRK
jgi:hypothetical protein